MRDADLRRAVMQELSVRHYEDADTRIVQEMSIWSGLVRVDIAVINGELHGVELKSEKDTLSRLPSQAEMYNQVFDRVSIVVGMRHIDKVERRVPEWWGLTSAHEKDGQIKLNLVRTPTVNSGIVPIQVARFLWKQEALSVLERRGLARGYRAKSLATIHARVADVLQVEDLRFEVRKALKARSRQAIGHKSEMSFNA